MAGLGKAMAVNRGPKPQRGKPQGKLGFHPLQVLKGLQTGKLLNPEQLQAAARALTVLETKPEIHGYAQIASQLGAEKSRESEGLSNLAKRTQEQVSGVYKNIAESEAQNLAKQEALGGSLTAQSANIAQQGSQNLAQMQTGALGDYESQLAMRGATGTAGGAQQALAQAVASQQAAQSADSQAAQQFANLSGADFANYGRSLSGSTQMQGAGQIGGIGRDVANRIAESNAKYNQNIQTARSKQAEAKASVGSKLVKNLLGLREGEQKFKTSQEAVAGEKADLALKQAENAEAAQQQQLENQRGAAKERREERGEALDWKKFGLETWKAHHPNAGEQNKKAKEVDQESNEVKALIGPVVSTLGKPPAHVPPKKVLNTYIKEINSKASADPRVVKKVVEEWFWGPHKQRERESAGVGGSHR